MNNNFIKRIEQYFRRRYVRRRIRICVSVLSAIVIFTTTYAMLMPVLTLEANAGCGIEEHEHTDACYERVLTCGQEESAGHQHTQDCYNEAGELICGLEESEGHVHTDDCYEMQLTCGKEVHIHSIECYRDEEEDSAQEESAGQSVQNAAAMSEEAGGEEEPEETEPEETEPEETEPEETEEEAAPEEDTEEEDAAQDEQDAPGAAVSGEAKNEESETPEEPAEEEQEEQKDETGSDNDDEGVTESADEGNGEEGEDGQEENSADSTEQADGEGTGTDGDETDTDVPVVGEDPAGEGTEPGEEVINPEEAEPQPAPAEQLDSIKIKDYISDRSTFYFLPEDADRSDREEWKEIDGSVLLDPEQKLIMHIAFRIPEGMINETNPVTKYNLPLTLSLTEEEVERINDEGCRIFEGTDPEADDLKELGRFEIKEEYNSDGEVEKRWLEITFNEEACLRNGGQIMTDGTTAVQPEKLEGFLECTIAAADLISLEKDSEDEERTVFLMEWNKDEDIETEITFDRVKLDKYLAELAGEEQQDPEAVYMTGTLVYEGADYTVTAAFDETAKLPEGTVLKVEEIKGEAYDQYLSEAQEAVGSGKEVTGARFFDITFETADGQSIEPQGMVDVRIDYKKAEKIDKDTSVEGVHFAEEGAETIEVETEGNEGRKANTVDAVTFQSDTFSVYGIVYTVDFHWEVDGKVYEFNLPGGGFVSFCDLVEVLGIRNPDAAAKANAEENGADDASMPEEGMGTNAQDAVILSLGDIEVSEETKKFVADVEKIDFSTSELLWVGKVENETTVGELKAQNGLDCEYSAELTEEQIQEINNTVVESGDWALISVLPFDTEEYLTVTMKTGEVFEVHVTDDQPNPFGLDGQSFTILAKKNSNNTTYSLANSVSSQNANCLRSVAVNNQTTTATVWTFEWTGEGKKYLIHDNNNQYMVIEDNRVTLTNNRDAALANPITVISKEGQYSFVNDNNVGLNIFGSSGFGAWAYDASNKDFMMTLQSATNVQKPGTIVTADTSGLLNITLFDYGPEDRLDTETNHIGGTIYTGGLNNHQLQFYSYGTTGNGINYFTGDDSVRPGIVADQLGTDKYPYLNTANSDVSWPESLGYLFGAGDSNVTQYSNVNRLFTLDEDGYYRYDSNDNYAYLDGSDFKVYSKTFPEEGADNKFFGVGFFPFNDYNEYYNCIHGRNFGGWHGDDLYKEGHYNHHFGMTMTGNFIMPPGGQYNGKDVTYEFSGDDDMWVYIDGVLILDIGGIHNPAHGTINFTDGTVTVNGVQQTNLRDKYKAVTGEDWDDSDFSNHDFRVFYMERGGMYSNLEVTFNLPLTAATETGDFNFDKVSSENESLKLADAEFSLFTDPACEQPFTLATVPVKATSDENGVVSFRNVPYGTYYMKETVYPTGYQAKTPEEIFTVVVGESGTTITSASGDSVTTVTNQPKKIDVEVEKIWTDDIIPPGASIEIVLGRYELVEDPNAPGKGTLVINDSYAGLPDGTAYHVTYTITGPNGYSKTITKSFTDTDKEISETVEGVPAGVEYTVTKQVQSISHYNVINDTASVTVTVPKNGSVDAQLTQSTFTRSAYRVRIYALNNQSTQDLYSDAYYEAGKALSIHIDHNAYNWGFFSFTVSSNTGWNSNKFTNDSGQQFTSNLNQDIDLYVTCDNTSWTKQYDWIKDPYITGASPVRASRAGVMMMSSRNRAGASTVTETASAPTLPTPPQDLIYQVDEEYASDPDIITLSGSTWTGKAENLPADNENGAYLYYIAEVRETGLPDGTAVSISDEVSQDGSLQVLTVTNTVPKGSLQITKTIQKNGSTDTAATGTFYYAVYNEAYESSSQTPVRTGSITVSEGGTETVEESYLPSGTYYVYELTGPNGTPITNGRLAITGEEAYIVIGSGDSTTVNDTAGSASLINNLETTQLSVTKNWSDSAAVDHSSDTITFKLYQAAYNANDEIISDKEYTGTYTNSITGSGTVAINDLPKNGIVNDVPVTYHYYIVEETGKAGYIQTIGQNEDGTEWTITNIPPDEYDQTTNLNVTKKWYDKDGNDVTASDHDDDMITFRLKQREVDSQYIPVTLLLVDARGDTDYTQVYYVKKGGSFALTVSKVGAVFAHGVNVSTNRTGDNNQAWSTSNAGTHTFTYSNVTDAMTVRAQLSFSFIVYDQWAEGAQAGTLQWGHSVSGTDMKSSISEVVAAAESNATLGEDQYVFTLHKSDLSGGPEEFGQSAVNWVGSLTNLPLYKKIADGTYYAYYYTVEEITVNGHAVTGIHTSGSTTTGFTDDYDVEINQDTLTINNKEREKVQADATKAWQNADGSTTAPVGGQVTFELFADGEATGKRVALDGKTLAEELAEDTTLTPEQREQAILAATSGEFTAWKAEWKSLPKYHPNSQVEIVYTVKEVVEYNGYKPNYASVASGETITNQQLSLDINLLKTDELEAPLAGATFKLQKYKDGNYREKDGEGVEVSVGTEGDQKGKLIFEHVTLGFYELEETVRPEGYIQITENPRFEVYVDPEDNSKLKVRFINTETVTYAEETNLFTVKNIPGAVLPEAGGPGTRIFAILGTMLMAFAGAGLFAVRRRRV